VLDFADGYTPRSDGAVPGSFSPPPAQKQQQQRQRQRHDGGFAGVGAAGGGGGGGGGAGAGTGLRLHRGVRHDSDGDDDDDVDDGIVADRGAGGERPCATLGALPRLPRALSPSLARARTRSLLSGHNITHTFKDGSGVRTASHSLRAFPRPVSPRRAALRLAAPRQG